MPDDLLWRHLKDLPYFRALLRAVEETMPPAVPTESGSLPSVEPLPDPPGRIDGTHNISLSTTTTPLSKLIGVEIDLKIRVHSPLLKQLFASRAPTAVLPNASRPRSAWLAENLGQAEWVMAAIALAVVGQVFISSTWVWPGIGAYAAAAMLMLAWAYRHPATRERLIQVATLSRRAELWLVIALIVLAAVARYYRLDQRMYGMDGDEKNWILQSYFSVVRGKSYGEFFLRHFQYLPVTFYLQGWAMQLFGVSLLTPRYLNATMSLLSIVLFYFMLRRMTNPATALTGGLLAAMAFAELSASRQAIHDTLVEFWVVLAYFTLLKAIQSQDRRWFLGAGIVTAVGMLTYETFYLTPVVGLIYLGICTLRDRKNWRAWVLFTAAFSLPLLFVLPSTLKYIGSRQGYHLNALRGGGELASVMFSRFVESLSTLFYRVRWPDQLVRWSAGPLVNVLLLPFFVIGLAYALAAWRKSHAVFLALWFIVQFFPFGIMGAPFPRVFYPALMGIAGLAALGLMAMLSAARQATQLNSRVLLGGFMAVLVVAVLYDVNVFSHKLVDPTDQQKRRELYDVVRASAATAPETYLPYMPFANDMTIVERDLIEFSVASVRGSKDPSRYYNLLHFDQLLGQVWDARTLYPTINIIFDKTVDDLTSTQRNTALATLWRCYPHSRVQPGRFYDIYELVPSDLQDPSCYSAIVAPNRPAKGDILSAGQPVRFEWHITKQLPSSTFQLRLERQNPQVLWLEAEDAFSHNEGWYAESSFAPDYTGSGYLTDNWHAGKAIAQVELAHEGIYRLWVRTHRRVINDQHNFIELDGYAPVEIAPAQTKLNVWVWQMAGEWNLEAGPHIITLTRTYGNDPPYNVFIDAVALSADPTFDPNVTSLWTATQDTGEKPMTDTAYLLDQGLPPGQYRWHVTLFDGDRLVDWLGQRGVSTQAWEFEVKEAGQ